MAVTRTEAVADGVTNVFSLSFPYLDESHVLVFTKGPSESSFTQYTQGFTFTTPTTVQLNTTPIDGTTVSVRRQTPSDDLLAVLTAPSTLNSDELNLVHTQLLYLIQENLDATLDVADEGVVDILSLLRFTYDIVLEATGTQLLNDLIGPVPVTESIRLDVDLASSRFAGPFTNPTGSNHVITLYKSDAGGSNETSMGTITVSPAGVIMVDFPSIVTVSAGQVVYARTTTANGLAGFAVTLRGFRI